MSLCTHDSFDNAFSARKVVSSRGIYIRVVSCKPRFLGIQQCFGVVYHELTTLRQVYFARASALAAREK